MIATCIFPSGSALAGIYTPVDARTVTAWPERLLRAQHSQSSQAALPCDRGNPSRLPRTGTCVPHLLLGTTPVKAQGLQRTLAGILGNQEPGRTQQADPAEASPLVWVQAWLDRDQRSVGAARVVGIPANTMGTAGFYDLAFKVICITSSVSVVPREQVTGSQESPEGQTRVELRVQERHWRSCIGKRTGGSWLGDPIHHTRVHLTPAEERQGSGLGPEPRAMTNHRVLNLQHTWEQRPSSAVPHAGQRSPGPGPCSARASAGERVPERAEPRVLQPSPTHPWW